MKILSFDLELNQDPSGSKIIEIGAAIGETHTGEVLDSFSSFVNPYQLLQPSIIQLTSISQGNVDNAGSIEEAYQSFVSFARPHECLRMPLVWGMGDGAALRKELGPGTEWLFGRRELDVKAVFQAYQMARNEKIQAGLAKALTRLGLQFKGKKHRAIDDAINTFLIYYELLKQFKISRD